jgi:hypothetical protein
VVRSTGFGNCPKVLGPFAESGSPPAPAPKVSTGSCGLPSGNVYLCKRDVRRDSVWEVNVKRNAAVLVVPVNSRFGSIHIGGMFNFSEKFFKCVSYT